ncbi:hypothetical protein SASPL_134174 [Salvia splendens]|uniref:Uncharacterized protein n=1 Tax=Salvia splendens TaxID=180675 RepID=A0A8X8X4E2_SALSN|nr:hypothetical protein SASPL_134174 [Salvia splendens]
MVFWLEDERNADLCAVKVKQHCTKEDHVYDDLETQYSVVEPAERVHERLENELPHFLKYMLESNVQNGFWLVNIILFLEDLVKTRKRRGRKPKYGVPYQRDIASPVENFKGENSILFSSEMVQKGPEITNPAQTNDLCYPETCFLRDHVHEGVTCR